MDDPEVVCYIAIKSPKNTIQYGGVVAAPIVKELLTESFTILNMKPRTGGIPLSIRYYIDKNIYTVDNFINKSISSIHQYNYPYKFVIEGSGKTVISQLPEEGDKLIEGGYVILYT